MSEQGAMRFKIDLRCVNCGFEWEELFAAKWEVESASIRGVWMHPTPCITSACQGRNIVCSVCELTDHVRIIGRAPYNYERSPEPVGESA